MYACMAYHTVQLTACSALLCSAMDGLDWIGLDWRTFHYSLRVHHLMETLGVWSE